MKRNCGAASITGRAFVAPRAMPSPLPCRSFGVALASSHPIFTALRAHPRVQAQLSQVRDIDAVSPVRTSPARTSLYALLACTHF